MAIAVYKTENLTISYFGGCPPPPLPIYYLYYTFNSITILNVSLILQAPVSTKTVII